MVVSLDGQRPPCSPRSYPLNCTCKQTYVTSVQPEEIHVDIQCPQRTIVGNTSLGSDIFEEELSGYLRHPSLDKQLTVLVWFTVPCSNLR